MKRRVRRRESSTLGTPLGAALINAHDVQEALDFLLTPEPVIDRTAVQDVEYVIDSTKETIFRTLLTDFDSPYALVSVKIDQLLSLLCNAHAIVWRLQAVSGVSSKEQGDAAGGDALLTSIRALRYANGTAALNSALTTVRTTYTTAANDRVRANGTRVAGYSRRERARIVSELLASFEKTLTSIDAVIEEVTSYIKNYADTSAAELFIKQLAVRAEKALAFYNSSSAREQTMPLLTVDALLTYAAAALEEPTDPTNPKFSGVPQFLSEFPATLLGESAPFYYAAETTNGFTLTSGENETSFTVSVPVASKPSLTLPFSGFELTEGGILLSVEARNIFQLSSSGEFGEGVPWLKGCVKEESFAASLITTVGAESLVDDGANIIVSDVERTNASAVLTPAIAPDGIRIGFSFLTEAGYEFDRYLAPYIVNPAALQLLVKDDLGVTQLTLTYDSTIGEYYLYSGALGSVAAVNRYLGSVGINTGTYVPPVGSTFESASVSYNGAGFVEYETGFVYVFTVDDLEEDTAVSVSYAYYPLSDGTTWVGLPGTADPTKVEFPFFSHVRQNEVVSTELPLVGPVTSAEDLRVALSSLSGITASLTEDSLRVVLSEDTYAGSSRRLAVPPGEEVCSINSAPFSPVFSINPSSMNALLVSALLEAYGADVWPAAVECSTEDVSCTFPTRVIGSSLATTDGLVLTLPSAISTISEGDVATVTIGGTVQQVKVASIDGTEVTLESEHGVALPIVDGEPVSPSGAHCYFFASPLTVASLNAEIIESLASTGTNLGFAIETSYATSTLITEPSFEDESIFIRAGDVVTDASTGNLLCRVKHASNGALVLTEALRTDSDIKLRSALQHYFTSLWGTVLNARKSLLKCSTAELKEKVNAGALFSHLSADSMDTMLSTVAVLKDSAVRSAAVSGLLEYLNENRQTVFLDHLLAGNFAGILQVSPEELAENCTIEETTARLLRHFVGA